MVIVGGTLIDGTGRPPLTDAAIVIHEGRIREVGKRGEISLPQGTQVIDAKGKTVLPGLIDGHCHYRDWMGEIYLALASPPVLISPTILRNGSLPNEMESGRVQSVARGYGPPGTT
jgi:urease alpha subunit